MTRSRIAPTPSGFLHRGNAYNFLLTEHLVRLAGGTLRLRIDDLDSGRVRPRYLDDIFESLAWLGIVPDAGPADPEEQAAQYSQLLRLAVYDAQLQRLADSGRVFACSCSRAEASRNAVNGQYPGTCRDRGIALDAAGVVWRFRTEPEETVSWTDRIAGRQLVHPHACIRDFVIRRRDGIAAYHTASLSDDIGYDINLIVRGADLLDSTAAQLLLARILGLSAFEASVFYHHPLITDAAGEKLSKSAGSASLRALRQEGISGAVFRQQAENWFARFLP